MGENAGACVDDEIDVKDLMRREWEDLRPFLVVTRAPFAEDASWEDLESSCLSRLNERAFTKRRMVI
jgi:hypothetical protein